MEPISSTILFHDGLEIQHQAAVGANVLADLVDHKEQAKVFALGVYVVFDLSDELFNGDVRCFGAVEPVARGGFAHAERFRERIDNIVLKKRKGVTGIFPALTMDLLKFLLECIHLSRFFYELLQLGNLEVVAVKAAVFIKHLGKYAENGGLVFVDRALGVDVKKNGVCRHTGAVFKLSKHHWVVKFVLKIIDRFFSCNRIVGDQVGQYLQKVRFTASKKA